mmetsp:Transcript_47987/g.96785  ORF Transcript_47987/g.96785 Transcript_47987/m.96785 type:complete len:167 (-) Transcript_47987:106-606(-)
MALAAYSPGQERRRRSAVGLLQAIAIAMVVSSCISGGTSFAAPRRLVVLGVALPALPGAQGAVAIPRVTDRALYINTQKVEFVPVFKQGMDYLEKYGIDRRTTLFAPRMVRNMNIYGTCFSASEAPDKTYRKLGADADGFEKYRDNIPKGVGSFDLKMPSTYEAPD